MTFVLGLAAAIGAAILFNLGAALQALEARRSPKSLALKVGLIGHLLRRPVWLAGTALGVIGIPVQVVALGSAPFTVVQTALTAGLVLLLLIAARYLHEHVDRSAWIGVGLLIMGVALVSWGSPTHSEQHRGTLPVALVAGALAAVAISPYVIRRAATNGLFLTLAAGVGFAGANIATKLASDDAGLGHWPNALAWGVILVALGVSATLTMMSALQRRTATMVIPVSTALQTFLPVVLEPLFLRERFASLTTGLLPLGVGVLIAIAGVVLVGRDPAVGELASGGA